jgi:hypothetical protein
VTSGTYWAAIYLKQTSAAAAVDGTNWAVSIKTIRTIQPQSPQEWIHLQIWRGLSSGTLLHVRLLETDRRFRGAYCLHYQDLVREAVSHLSASGWRRRPPDMGDYLWMCWINRHRQLTKGSPPAWKMNEYVEILTIETTMLHNITQFLATDRFFGASQRFWTGGSIDLQGAEAWTLIGGGGT